MSTFGERLKMLRKSKKITQQQLADLLFVNKSSISRYESNSQLPESSQLQKLADYFDVSLDYLVGRTDIRNYSESVKVDSKKNELLKAKFNKDNLELSKKEIEDLIEKLECLLEKLNDIIDIKNLL